MKNFSHPMMDIAFSAERAIQDELKRESKGDVYTILLSYIIMFAYISIGTILYSVFFIGFTHAFEFFKCS